MALLRLSRYDPHSRISTTRPNPGAYVFSILGGIMIEDERKWRISKSGFSIKTGWADDKRIIAKYPGIISPLDNEQFKVWFENAQLICDFYNKSLEQIDA